MAAELPSIWSMDRAGIEETLREGRSPRGAYTAQEIQAVRAVLGHAQFEALSPDQRREAFAAAWRAQPQGPAVAADPTVAAGGGLLLPIGWLLVLTSLALCLFAYVGYETSIHTDADFSGTGFIPARDIINTGLLQNQLMLFLLGLAGVLSGVAAIVANSIVAAIRSPKGEA